MKVGQFSNERIMAILREAERGEKPILALCKDKDISEATFYACYAWRKRFGGLPTRDVQRLSGQIVCLNTLRLKTSLRRRPAAPPDDEDTRPHRQRQGAQSKRDERTKMADVEYGPLGVVGMIGRAGNTVFFRKANGSFGVRTYVTPANSRTPAWEAAR